MKIDLGKLKTWQSRIATYTGLIQFIMIFYLFIIENKWLEWYYWLLFFTVITTVIMWVDIVVIYPQQLAYNRVKDPEWMKYVKNQQRIMDHLGVTYEK